MNEAMSGQSLSFRRASFGAWKLVVEYLGKQTRLLLQDSGKKHEDVRNGRAICESIFADTTLRLPTILSGKPIADIFSATNKMRNDWGGHGGVVGQEEARIRNNQLPGQLEKLRFAMSDLWDSAVVANALHCRPRKGVFENEMAIPWGSNSEFLKESRSMSTWLDVDSLYVVSGHQGDTLKLLPLIQVGASPESAKNACYFFNRAEKECLRFISYHYVSRPELSGPFQKAADAITFLSEL